jgi:hypothetical protein
MLHARADREASADPSPATRRLAEVLVEFCSTADPRKAA